MSRIRLGYKAVLISWLIGIVSQGFGQVPELNLQDWNPGKTKVLYLKGTWAFYWNELATADELDARQAKPTLVPVPASWDSYQRAGQPISANGCATYRVKLHLPPTTLRLALQIPFVWTSYRVLLNGEIVAESGNPACKQENYRAQMIKAIIPLPEKAEVVDLVVQVADYDFFFSGLVEAPLFATEQQLRIDQDFANAGSLAVWGGLLIMALYHLLIFLFRKKERAMLYFGIICLAMALRFAVFGDHYLYTWLNLYSGFFSFGLQVRAYYLLTFVLAWVGLLFLKALFPKDVWPKATYVYGSILGIYTLFAIVVPTRTFTASLVGSQVVLVVAVSYLFFVIIRAAYFKRADARFLLIGLAGTVLAGVHDALQTAGIFLLGDTELLTYGFLFFLLVQFVVLSRRYSFAFSEVEDLSANLERKVEERTEQLRLANDEISQKNQDITDSIEYAHRIQLSILPKQDGFKRFFKDSFVLYWPKDIVSGDFYWFHEQEGKFYVCAADCTGHGVPGAFMSVLGTNLLSTLVYEERLPAPAHLLGLLSGRVKDALKQNQQGASQDGMDVALCSFEANTAVAEFAGANRPLWVARGEEIIEYQPTKLPIGGGERLYNDSPYTAQVINLLPGDAVYLFTDGITDQFGGEARRKFSTKRFKTLLQSIHSLPMAAQQQHLHQEVRSWMQTTAQTDDILVLGIRI